MAAVATRGAYCIVRCDAEVRVIDGLCLAVCLQTTFTRRRANLGNNVCKYDKAC
jgi:hypothetical protein